MVAAAALGFPSFATAEEGITSVPVKMTYVNMDDPDKSYGEIKAGETAQAGFNTISNNTVGWGNTKYAVDFITYLQVNVSEIQGTITKATLKFEAMAGTSDNKRALAWGVGYNNSDWSESLTYNTADRSIVTLGDPVPGSSKSGTTWDKHSFDITEAIKNANKNGFITILVYETSAGGGSLRNPTAEVEWTTASTYDITFKEANGVNASVTVNGSNATSGIALINGTYNFTATAEGYKDYTGVFTVAGTAQEVEFTMIPKDKWNYTVNAVDSDGKLLGELSTGEYFENEDVTYYYPEYYLYNNSLFSINKNGSDPYFGKKANLNENNKKFEVTYNSSVISDVVFYSEAENIKDFTSKATNNAPIRCSNGLGGIVSGDVYLTTLYPGKYKIHGQVWGTKGLTAGVKIKSEVEGEEDTNLWTLASTGSLAQGSNPEEFELTSETELYVYTESGNDNRMLDLIYITGKEIAAANYTIKFEDEAGNQVKEAVTRTGLVGDPIVITDEDKAEIPGTDVKYTFEAVDPENPTVGADGNTVVTVKFNKISLKTIANYTIKFVDENKKDIKDAEVKEGTIGAEITLPEEYLQNMEVDGQRYFYAGNDLESNKTIKSDGTTVVTISFRKAAVYKYTVKAKGIGTIIASGTCIEGDSETVPYSKYIRTEDGKVYSISTKNYRVTVTPDADDYVVELDYAETDITDGVFFAEAESVLAAIAKDDCSNMAGARAQNETEFYTLKPGIYKVTIGTYGSGSPTYTIKAGDVVVLEQKATGTKEFTSEEFSVSVETKITFQGGDSSRLLDYILITGKEVKEADYTLKYVVGEGEGATEIKTVTKKGNVGAAIVLDRADIAPFQTEDATYTCVSNDAAGKIVTIEGTVVTITCKKTEGYVLHFVDKDDEGSHIIKDHIEIAATVGSPIVVPDEHKQEFECKEHGVLFEYDSDDSEGKTVSEKADIVTVYCKAVKADYTLDYVADGKSIKKETKTGRVGDTVAVAPEDLSEFKDADGNLYVYTGEDPEETKITRDGSTVVTIKYSKVINVEAITLDKTTAEVEVGQSIELKATVTPADATNPTVTWESSNNAIATVDANGKVTGVAVGTVTITAKAGDKTATCTVSVDKGAGVSFGFDNEAPVQVYDLNGRYIANKVEGLASGYYIIRQGNDVKKVHIR